jgi:hypothetical protein
MLKLKFEAHPDFPGDAHAWISLEDHSRDENGWPLITPSAAGEAELDGYIDHLHAELEELRKRGQRRFREIKRKWAEGASR